MFIKAELEVKKNNIHIKGIDIMKEITYRIYADESVSDGKYYSNFYGRSINKFIRCQFN